MVREENVTNLDVDRCTPACSENLSTDIMQETGFQPQTEVALFLVRHNAPYPSCGFSDASSEYVPRSRMFFKIGSYDAKPRCILDEDPDFQEVIRNPDVDSKQLEVMEYKENFATEGV